MTIAICIASGTSLRPEDVDYCRGKGKVYVVNNGYLLAPWADVLYACDGAWWDLHIKNVRKIFKGELWTIDHRASTEYRINAIGVLNSAVFSNHPDAIVTGCNSGFQALNLAVIQGARKVILLGYDMKLGVNNRRHWHGDHPKPLLQTNKGEYERWIKHYEKASSLIPVPVINCTRDTNLNCFPKEELEDVI